MRSRGLWGAIVVCLSFHFGSSPALAQPSVDPGPLEGVVPIVAAQPGAGRVLPGGRKITPAGTQIEMGILPLAVAPAPDGIHALVTNNGIGQNCIYWANLVTQAVEEAICPANVNSSLGPESPPDPDNFIPNGLSFGVAFLPEPGTEDLPFTGRIFVSGASQNNVLVYQATGGVIVPQAVNVVGVKDWPAGIALAAGKVYVARLLSGGQSGPGCVAVIDPGTAAGSESVPAGKDCITVGRRPWAAAAVGGKVLVANRGADSSPGGSDTLSIIDPTTDTAGATATVGDHPAAIAFAEDKILVANANSDDLTILQLDGSILSQVATVDLEAYSGAGFGSFPSGLGFSATRKRLYVANAGLNAVTVVDLANFNAPKIVGHIPTGWYPSSVALSTDGETLLVTNAKRALPRTPAHAEDFFFNYVLPTPGGGTFTNGFLSLIDVDAADAVLADLTKQVCDNNLLPQITGREAPCEAPNRKQMACTDWLPEVVCQNVKHVFFVVRENKTYDQLFGDILDEYPADKVSVAEDGNLRPRRPNADPTLLFWPLPFTANAHKLAREFVLLDNYYTETEVSEQGHQWTTAGIVTDYYERMWPLPKGFRGRGERDDEMIEASSDYIFEKLDGAEITWRNYGEDNGRLPNVEYKPAEGKFHGDVPDPFYPHGGDQLLPDMNRLLGCPPPSGCAVSGGGTTRHYEFSGWKATFDQDVENCIGPDGNYVNTCTLPAFEYLILPRDHTTGVLSPPQTPQEQVLDNDQAIGLLVEIISSQPEIWKRSAIFIIEDDPQSGADHVSSHRSIALVVSPWVKRNYLSSRHYSMSGLIRAMGLLLGAPPLNLYDAHADPLSDIWVQSETGEDSSPYEAVVVGIPPQPKPAEELIEASLKLGIVNRGYDSVPDAELNRLLCLHVKATLNLGNRCLEFLR